MVLLSPVRRAATVWRRSIQARVVISTLLLSAVVVSLVGWVLLQQITDGLVRSKTDSAVSEATRATAEAELRLSAASGNDFDANTQVAQLVRTLVSRGTVQGYEIVLTGPIAGSSSGVAAGSLTSNTPGVLQRQRPERAAQPRGEQPGRRNVLHLLHDHLQRGERAGAGAGRGHRLPGHAARRRRHLHAVLPLPDDRPGEDPLARTTGAGHRRRPAAGARRRPHLAGHPAGRRRRSGWPAGSPSGWRPDASRSGCTSAATTTSPGSARRSTRWRPACRSRSASSRSSPASSGASSPTSPTSCAPR